MWSPQTAVLPYRPVCGDHIRRFHRDFVFVATTFGAFTIKMPFVVTAIDVFTIKNVFVVTTIGSFTVKTPFVATPDQGRPLV